MKYIRTYESRGAFSFFFLDFFFAVGKKLLKFTNELIAILTYLVGGGMGMMGGPGRRRWMDACL